MNKCQQKNKETKKHSRKSPEVKFKEFSLTKQKKPDLLRTMSEFGKQFLKKSDKKTENQCQNAACEQKTTCEKWKFGSKNKEAQNEL